MTLYVRNVAVQNEGGAGNKEHGTNNRDANNHGSRATKRRPYFRPTTPQQRHLLFETWLATGNVAEACARARVSLRTFYYWRPRFEEGGFAALAEERSHAPKNPSRIAPDIVAQIIDLKQTHPDWGKLRIAKHIVRQNESIASLSPNTVRRVLIDAGLWPSSATPSHDIRSGRTSSSASTPQGTHD